MKLWDDMVGGAGWNPRMKTATVDDFLKALQSSRLLSPDEYDQVCNDATQSPPADAESLARSLVQNRRLTRWQAGMLLAGRTAFFLGKYKLLNELGRGGMGAVFQAEQASLGRIVALKIMAQKLVQDAEAVARFHREIHAAAALIHPHVVTALDADHVQNTHFLVMEYVAGEGLDTVVKREAPLPILTACEYVRQAALGLQHAHECGMAHRDIKPSNLLLTWTADREPLVKILDLGLARFTSAASDDQGELTRTGQVMGTPDYIAPEQARSTKNADIRSDIFSLGCTLFQLLTGKLPFTGESVMEKLMARAVGAAPPLRGFRPEAPPELEAIVAKMLAYDPQQRYQTPEEVATALAGFIAGQTLLTTRSPATAVTAKHESADASPENDQNLAFVLEPQLNQFLQDLAHEADADEEVVETISTHHPAATGNPDDTQTIPPPVPAGVTRAGKKLQAQLARQQRRDRTALVRGAAAAVVLLMAGVAVWTWHRQGATQLVVDWPEDERHKSASLSVDRLNLPVPAKGVITIPAGRAGKRTLELFRPGYKDVTVTLEFARGETKVFRPEWEPTRQTLRRRLLKDLGQAADALRTRLGGQWPTEENVDVRKLIDRYRGARSQFLQTAEQKAYAALGRQLPSLADRLTAASIPAAQRKRAEIANGGDPLPAEVVAIWGDGRLKLSASNTTALAVSPDGKLAATANGWGLSSLWNLETGELVHTPHWPTLSTGLAFSDDGRWLAIPKETIEVWSIAENRREWTTPITDRPEARADGLTFVPRRRWLAWGGMGTRVHRCDFEARQPLPPLEFPESGDHVTSVGASASGRWLAAGGKKGIVRVWDLEANTSLAIDTQHGLANSVAISPDESLLLVGGADRITIWALPSGKRVREILGLHYGAQSLSWNAAGTLFAANTHSSDVQIWNASTGELHATRHFRGRLSRLTQFTADGRLVSVGLEGELQVQDFETERNLIETDPLIMTGALDPQGDWLAVSRTDNTVELISLIDGKPLRRIAWGAIPNTLKVSPDGRWLAGASYHYGNGVRLFDLSQSADADERGPTSDANIPHGSAIAFTPDSRLLIGAGRGEVVAWNTSDSREVFRRELRNSRRNYDAPVIAVTPDGKLLAVGTWDPRGGEMSVLAIPEGRILRVFPTLPINDLVMAPDSRHAIVTAATMTSIVDLTQVREPKQAYLGGGHPVGMLSTTATADGKQIVGANFDGKLYFWPMYDPVSEREIVFATDRPSSVKQVLATPDGRHLVLITMYGEIMVLRL